MTFRIDDLLVSVLPSAIEAAEQPTKQDPNCTQCTCQTAPPTPCCDAATSPCHMCEQTCEDNTDCDDTGTTGNPAKTKNEWRSQQFDLLSRELEVALSR